MSLTKLVVRFSARLFITDNWQKTAGRKRSKKTICIIVNINCTFSRTNSCSISTLFVSMNKDLQILGDVWVFW